MTEQIARWAEALDPQLIATTASPVHVASVIEQARQHILTLTQVACPPKARKGKPVQRLAAHVFKPAHFKAAARRGSTPEKLIAGEMAALKRRASQAPARSFPRLDRDLSSTSAYVHAFYAANSLGSREHVEKLFQPLSTAPTTWPDESTEAAELAPN